MSAPWKTIRVFISSTFRDMQAERDHLVRFVFPKLREDLLQHRIHVVDVDLRWGVTGDEDAREVCREVIGECRPRFLCILGGRYGWVPPGKTKSITADEIDYGVLNQPPEVEGPVRAFFYFRKDEATASIPAEISRNLGYREHALPAEIETFGQAEAERLAVERANELERMKQEIIDRGLPVHPYDAQWDAAQERLVGLKDFGDQVLDDLLQSLKADPELASRFTTDSTAQPDEFKEETEQMDAFIEERTERFVLGSRQRLMDQLFAFASADGTPSIFVLTGDPGSGKSAFLAKFVRDLAEPPSDIRHSAFVIPHFVGASTGSTDLRRTLRRLCHKLAKAAGNTEPLPLDIKELITHFQILLTEAAAKQRIILVFDALNQLDATDGAQWLNWLPRVLPSGVRIVASVIAPAEGEKEHQTFAILKNRPGVRIERLDPLQDSDAHAIIENFRERFKKRFSPGQIAALLDKSESRLPLYLLTALEELRTLGTDEQLAVLAAQLFSVEELERLRKEDRDKILTLFIEKELPCSARELFRWILCKRLASDSCLSTHPQGGAAGLVEKFSACLGVSRYGLSPAELTALLDPGDPLGNVAALLRLLRPYLMRRGELLDFYHGQFREAAKEATLKTGAQRLAAHNNLAAYFRAQADPEGNQTWKGETNRGFEELPYQLASSNSQRELVYLLGDTAFAAAKSAKGGAFDLLNDYNVAACRVQRQDEGYPRLFQLKQIVRREAERLSRYPECSLQQILLGIAALASPDIGLKFQAEKLTQAHRGSAALKVWSLVPEHRVRLVTQAPTRGDVTVENICATQTGVLLRHKGGAWEEYSKDFEKMGGGVTPAAYFSRIARGGEVVVFTSAGTAMFWNPWPTSVPKFCKLAEPVSAVACSGNGRFLALGGSGGSLQVRDLRNIEAPPLLCGNLEGPIKAVWFSSDDSVTVVTGSGVLARAAGDSEWKFTSEFTTDQDCRLACTAGGDAVCLTGEDNLLQCFGSEGGLKWQSIIPAKAHSLAFFPGDKGHVASILAGLEDGTLQELNALDGMPGQSFKISERALQSVEWHPAAAAVLCSDSTGSVFFVSRSCPDEVEFRAWPACQRILAVHWNELDQRLETLSRGGERHVIQKSTCEADGDWQVSALHAINGSLDDAWILADGIIVAQHRESDESQIWLHCPVGKEQISSRCLWKGNSLLNWGGPSFIHSMAVSRCGTHYAAASMFSGEKSAVFRHGKLSRFTFGQRWQLREGFVDEFVLSDRGEVIVTTQARGSSTDRLPARILSCRAHTHVLLDEGWGGGIAGAERGSARALFGTAVSRNGCTITAIDTNRDLWLFSFDPSRPKIPPRGSTRLSGVVSCCLSDSGTLCAAHQTDQAISIFHIDHGGDLKQLAVILPPGQPSCFRFSSTGRHLIVAGQDFIQALSF